jgi:hypothetical protein
LSYIPGSFSINCTRTKSAASLNTHTILRNKRVTEACYRTNDSSKPRSNKIVRRLVRLVAWNLNLSVFPRVALPFPQFVLFHSVSCVQLRLIPILGNCSCVAVASFPGRPSP